MLKFPLPRPKPGLFASPLALLSLFSYRRHRQ